jgi:hypothetical protein
MGDQYIASYIMFSKRLQMVDEDGAECVEEEDDDDHTEWGWIPPEVIPVAFPPSDLRRWWHVDSMFMCF